MTETKAGALLELLLGAIISGLLSPSISARATLYGWLPVAKSTFAANDDSVIVPAVDILRQ